MSRAIAALEEAEPDPLVAGIDEELADALSTGLTHPVAAGSRAVCLP